MPKTIGSGKTMMYIVLLFVDPTPNGELVKKLREVEEKHKISDNKRIKFVEKSGVKMVHKITRKNPFRNNCNEELCMACQSSKNDKVSNCRKNNVGYTIIYDLCKMRGMPTAYEGETDRNLRSRGEEHIKTLKRKDRNSVLYKQTY